MKGKNYKKHYFYNPNSQKILDQSEIKLIMKEIKNILNLGDVRYDINYRNET